MHARSLALARHTLRLYLSDPAPLLVFLLMPLGLMAFLAPASKAMLMAQGYAAATGAEQAVPGMTVMFSFFLTSVVGIQFYREHGWGTWDRLRIASGAFTIMVGKLVPGVLLILCQTAVVFVSGGILFHLHITGSLPGLFIVISAFALCAMAMAMALIAWCRTLDQLNVLSNLAAMIFSGLGGAFAPVTALPHWAQMISRASPAYWAILGMRGIILDAEGFGFALRMAAAMTGFTLLFALCFALRFKMKETKVSDT
jgi:ABC-2 type transport system permease protein